MKRLLAYIILALAGCMAASATDFANETLHYKVMYKWGLINKEAGRVSIDLRNVGPEYHAQLTARSAKWADKIYKVRDTLTCQVVRHGFRPLRYEKMSHEGPDDKHDVVQYTHRGNTVIGECTRFEKSNGKVKKDEQRTLEAEGMTVDMLSAFYYMRQLPFDTWQPGHKLSINIFSGKRQELLTIEYHGVERLQYDGEDRECYYISFIFTSDGKNKTSDDMFAWISTAPDRIPLKLEGKLPIGSVKCFYQQ